jgi:hypothetical protein
MSFFRPIAVYFAENRQKFCEKNRRSLRSNSSGTTESKWLNFAVHTLLTQYDEIPKEQSRSFPVEKMTQSQILSIFGGRALIYLRPL